MNTKTVSGRTQIISASAVAAFAVLVSLCLGYFVLVQPAKSSNRLLLAPMVGQIEPCIRRTLLPPEHVIDPAFVQCTSEDGSAAAVIDHTLSRLGPRVSANGRFELGYALNVPLLKFLVLRDGAWEVDQVAIDRTIKIIAQSERRLVLYLFSTHFSVSASLEPVLAKDQDNLAQTPLGPVEMGGHYGMDVYPWSVARTDNTLTKARLRVIEAIDKALCAQPARVRDRIAAITVLGEVHQMFPSFETGMGFKGPYLVSDYSHSSILGFRRFLKTQFYDIADLNRALGGAAFESFDLVNPPSKDIRTSELNNFWEHIDSYAAGSFPVEGWLAPHPRLTGRVQVYVDGRFAGYTPVGLGRQDVLEHLPSIGTADVGWRVNVDFRRLKPGFHSIAVMAESKQGAAVLLGVREVAIIDKTQLKPVRLPTQTLPPHEILAGVQGSVDSPIDQTDLYFNPLAELWLRYREQQVVDYLKFVAEPLRKSCLADVPRYIHQLFPYPNPSWDESKYAVGASLNGTGDLRLGVSLYGEATYGQSFFEWKRHRLGSYGVTEFHPLRSMDSAELTSVFDHHMNSGAQFLSFFLEGRGPVNRPYAITERTIPFIGERNVQNGSDQLYRSLQQLMKTP